MTDHNSAFLWETEALRSSPQRATETKIDVDLRSGSTGEKDPLRWVTLRDANRATGIPVETLRKWARRSTIPSYLTPTTAGTNIRMVDLEGIRRRATELGRALQSESQVAAPPPRAESPAQPPAGQSAATSAPGSEPTPPGTMIVPIDAWNKMLNQLGNLHEAGQQLAVARERAAKAETEAVFLRERLAELRNDSVPSIDQPEPTTPNPLPQESIPEPVLNPPEKVWQYLVRRVRDRRPG